MINKYYDKIQVVEFDLTSTCQAYCASCSRYVIEDGAVKLNPYVKFNNQVSIDAIANIFSSELIVENVGVSMVGSIGDPLAHTDIVGVLETIFKHKPKARVVMHTNGGLGHPDTYRKIAQIEGTIKLYFSIDGLADTNHLYRDSVVWERIEQNVQAFIQAGGTARWKYIVFDWNKHQVEAARQLSQQWGFQKFETIKDRSRGEERDEWNSVKHNIKKKEFGRLKNEEFRIASEKKASWDLPDTTECIGNQVVYINPQEMVVPCCKWATGFNWFEHRSEMIEFMYTDNEQDWNSLKHNSFNDILHNKFWDKLGDSLQLSTTSCTRCLTQCSRVSG